jgi:hypothetical protein
VRLFILYAPGGSFFILPAQMILIVVQMLPNRISQQWIPTVAKPPAPTVGADGKEEAQQTELCGRDTWYMHPLTQLISVWMFLTTAIFSVIEFQYNAVLAHELDADGIAQVTANLASVASVGQTCVNLMLTPFLLQHVGVWAALLVTPTAYIFGEGLIMSYQTVITVFVCRSMDFIFRYTISDNTKQILFKSIPPHQLIDARAFIDGTLKKAAPMVVGFFLIFAQNGLGFGSYQLVRPLSFVQITLAATMIPLVLHLARVTDESPKSVPILQ